MHFARANGNTLLIATTDHGNSGLTMGNLNTSRSYAETPADTFIQPLKKAKLSVTGAGLQLKKDRSNLIDVLNSYGLDGLTKKQVNKLKEAKDLESEMVKMLAKRAHLGFTTRGHTGEDVFLYAYGPQKPKGLVNNTDLSKYIIKHLELDPLADITKKRFNPAKEHYEQQGYKTRIEHAKSGQEAVFIAEKEGMIIELPANQNIKRVNGESFRKKGLIFIMENHFGFQFTIIFSSFRHVLQFCKAGLS